jgi:hypothetical protein
MILLQERLFALLDGSVEGTRAAVQSAIRLEHATIPTYLYALYSIQPGSNREAAQIIRSVVIEEMLHMTIACNLMNAIGASPVIDDPKFVPDYPGPLPGGVESDLTVTLAPLSITQVESVFMRIEEPEDPLRFPVAMLAAEEAPKTIGMFYKRISEQLKESFFTGDPALQVAAEWWPKSELSPIVNLETARAAIRIIIEQGEGTTTLPTDLEGQYAHYYRFAEIAKGRRLIKNPDAGPQTPPDKRYIYGGDKVPLDTSKIQNLVVNPALKGYPQGSAAQVGNDAFNSMYTNLLRSLQLVFTGHPDQLASAIGIMESLKEQALGLTQVALDNSTFAGPTFQYRSLN